MIVFVSEAIKGNSDADLRQGSPADGIPFPSYTEDVLIGIWLHKLLEWSVRLHQLILREL